MSKRVLNVGHCGPDHRAIATLIEHHFAAQVLRADSLLDTLRQLQSGPFDLVLVNRRLDRDGSEGLELIRQIKVDPRWSHTPVMMITNFPEDQQSAQRVGAEEGFGKRSLGSSDTLAKLQPFLGDARPARQSRPPSDPPAESATTTEGDPGVTRNETRDW